MRYKIWGLLEPYLKGLEWAGATVVLLPPQNEGRVVQALSRLDGLLLPGGIDIDPAHFGEEPLPGLGEVNLERDQLELFLARQSAQRGLPTLGICRGVQVMNVALGGSLYQDLPSQGFKSVQHYQQSEPPVLAHSAELVGFSALTALFDPRFRVNSYHHQALKDLAPGLQVAAQAPDGVVEAVQLANHPFYVGVQWHPELLPQQWGLFAALVEAATARQGLAV